MSTATDTANTENGESSLAPTVYEGPHTFVAINKEDQDEDTAVDATNPSAPIPADTNDRIVKKDPSSSVKRKRNEKTKVSAGAGDAAESAAETPEVPNVKKARSKAGTAEGGKVRKPAKKAEQTDAVSRKKGRGGKAKVKNETASEEQEGKGENGMANSRDSDGEEMVPVKEEGDGDKEEGQPESGDAGLNTPPPEEEKKPFEKPSASSTKLTKQRSNSAAWTSVEDQVITKMAQEKAPWKDVAAAVNKLQSCATPRDSVSTSHRWHNVLKHLAVQWEEEEIIKLKFLHQEIVKNPFGVVADRMNAAFSSKKFTKAACEKKIKEAGGES